MSDGSFDLCGDPSAVSQIDTGCVPCVMILELSIEKAEELSHREIPDSLPAWKKLLRLLQSPWGRERRKQGIWLLIIGQQQRILIVEEALYKEHRERRRRQRKAAGE